MLKLRSKKWLYIIPALPILFLGVSLLMTALTQQLHGHVDRNFLLRFSIPVDVMREFPISWLGNRMTYYYPLDNAWWFSLIWGGILVTGWNMVFFPAVGVHYVRHAQYAELLLFSIFLIYGFMANVTWMASANSSLLLMEVSPHAAQECPDLPGGVGDRL